MNSYVVSSSHQKGSNIHIVHSEEERNTNARHSSGQHRKE